MSGRGDRDESERESALRLQHDRGAKRDGTAPHRLVALVGGLLGLASALLPLAWSVVRTWGGGNTKPHVRVTLDVAPVGGMLLALGLALAPLVILREEVVLGTLLVAGLGLLLPAWGRTADAR